jgi:hypothetical protein
MEGICKLCRNVGILRYSHIIPEFCHRGVYNHIHRATKLTADPKYRSFMQKGYREYLLCDECEARFNKWETAFAKYWYKERPLPSHVKLGLITISGFDYAAFKLFHLSIIWRANVTTITGFNSVKLGPYEDKIRQMLLAENPGAVDCIPILGFVLRDKDGSVMNKFVIGPQRAKIDCSVVYFICYAGCEWCFVIKDPPHREAAFYASGSPQANGTMRLLVCDLKDSVSIIGFAKERMRFEARLDAG